MARLLNGSTQFVRGTSMPVTAAPFSVALWAKCGQDSAYETPWSLSNSGSAWNWFALAFRGNFAGDPIFFYVRDNSGGGLIINSTTGYTVNKWHHLMAVEASSTDHRVYLDGGGKATSTTSQAPTGLDRHTIGRQDDSSPGSYFTGEVGPLAIWDTVLSDADAVALASGISPLFLKSEHLVAFYPQGGFGVQKDVDVIGGHHFTVPFNSPTWAPSYPPLRTPAMHAYGPGTAAPPVTGSPWYYYANQQAVRAA